MNVQQAPRVHPWVCQWVHPGVCQGVHPGGVSRGVDFCAYPGTHQQQTQRAFGRLLLGSSDEAPSGWQSGLRTGCALCGTRSCIETERPTHPVCPVYLSSDKPNAGRVVPSDPLHQ